MVKVVKKKPVKKAAAPKAPREKKVKETVICNCGCGEKTNGGRFLPGHDARFHGRVKRLADGRQKWADLEAELGKKGEYSHPHYKEALKHADKTPYVGKAKKAGKATPKAKGGGKKATKKATKKAAAVDGSTKPAKALKAKDDTTGATGEATKDTARLKALRGIDKAGELTAIGVSEVVGVKYSLKPLLKQMVEAGLITKSNQPRPGTENPGPDVYRITDAGRAFYKEHDVVTATSDVELDKRAEANERDAKADLAESDASAA